jgi:periplasmic protein TonB
MRFERDEFDGLLEEVIWQEANLAAPAGLEERVMKRMWAVRMEREMTSNSVSLASFAEGGREETVWASLWGGLRELVAPEQLPELKLKSRPVAVVDRMKEKRSSSATWGAVALHLLAFPLIALMVSSGVRLAAPVRVVSEIVVPVAPPLVAERDAGGGGGQRGPMPVTQGHLPKVADRQIVPPTAPPMEEPKILMEPTIEVQHDVKMATVLPNIGMPNSPLVGTSLGGGRGTGLGSGDGSGIGPGYGGNIGGGPKRIGGGVSAPVLVFSVEPEFSEQARKAKVSGNVLVNIWVDEKGNPSHVRVLRGIGLGLDERAVEAVKQYKFKPALENGRPVMVELNVDVTFQIF